MPLSRLAFTNPLQNLYSIEEGDDETSLSSSNEDDVLELLTKTSRQSSSSAKKTSANKPSEQSTPSCSSSFISEQLGKLSKSVLEIQEKLEDDTTTADETSTTILQNLSTILTGMQQMQLQMTSFDEELKKSNATHKEALQSLKVRLTLFFL